MNEAQQQSTRAPVEQDNPLELKMGISEIISKMEASSARMIEKGVMPHPGHVGYTVAVLLYLAQESTDGGAFERYVEECAAAAMAATILYQQAHQGQGGRTVVDTVSDGAKVATPGDGPRILLPPHMR